MVLAEAYPEEETPISTEEGGGNPGVPDIWFCMINSDGQGDRPEKMSPTDFERYGTIGSDGKAATVDPSIGYLLPCKEPTTEVPATEEPTQPATQESTAEVPTEEPSVTEVPVTEPSATEEPTVMVTEEPATEVPTDAPVEPTMSPVTPEVTQEPTTSSISTEMSDGTEGSGESASEPASPLVPTEDSAEVAAGRQIALAAVAAADALMNLLQAA